jgi:hypothetical protein
MENHIYFLTVILVILVCFFIFRYLSIDYLQYKKSNPYLIEHTRRIDNGIQAINTNEIRKSIDQHHGIEFTYAFWFKIDSVSDDKRHNILLKGSETEQCPGIYVTKDRTKIDNSINDNTLMLQIDMSIFNNPPDCDNYNESDCKSNLCKWDTSDASNPACKPYECSDIKSPNVTQGGRDDGKTPMCYELSDYCNINENSDPVTCVNRDKETCIVNNIPIKKWTHLIVMLVGSYLDVYINGFLYERFEIKGVPKQNTKDLIIGASGTNTAPGHGSIMRLQYFNYAIPASKINMIVSKSEITKDTRNELEDNSTVDYLDKNYWIGENVDYNKKMF